MPSFTRKAIMEAFLKILDEKPLGKITIRDIVDECGINRNTFYYHFADIPELLETIIRRRPTTLFPAIPTCRRLRSV